MYVQITTGDDQPYDLTVNGSFAGYQAFFIRLYLGSLNQMLSDGNYTFNNYPLLPDSYSGQDPIGGMIYMDSADSPTFTINDFHAVSPIPEPEILDLFAIGFFFVAVAVCRGWRGPPPRRVAPFL